MKKKLLILVCFALLFTEKGNCQNWLLAGNIAVPADKLGTLNGVPLNIVTNNIQRMTILANGLVGIGTTLPTYALDIYNIGTPPGGKMFRTNGAGGIDNEWAMWVGFAGTQIGRIYNPAGSPNFVMEASGATGSDEFNTGGTGTAFERMIITDIGRVGIGTGFTGPLFLLDVKGGDIDVSTPTDGYRINGKYVLWQNAITSNIYVGVNAGNGIGTGIANTAVGNNALTNFTSGMSNTATGSSALNADTKGINNTATGANALLVNTTGDYNNAFGFDALQSNTTGTHNTAQGDGAMVNNVIGSFNAAFGTNAMHNNLVNGNSAFGNSALNLNANGVHNTAVGNEALHSTIVSWNTGIGDSVLYLTTTGFRNTATGGMAMLSNKTGNYNTADGYVAMFHNLASWNTGVGDSVLYNNTSGFHNTATGGMAMKDNLTGNYNTADGYVAMFNNLASWNTGVGDSVLYNNTTGFHNTATGAVAMVVNKTGSSNTAVGYFAMDNTNADWNTGVGDSVLFKNSNGIDNTSTGGKSLALNMAGSFNTANGYVAMFNNLASWNTGVGDSVLYNNTTGTYNTSTGGRSALRNKTGTNNTANGYGALYTNVSASSNTATGFESLYKNTGERNSAFGDSTLYNNTTGDSNSAAGYGALLNTTTGNGNSGLGYKAGGFSVVNNPTGLDNTYVGALTDANAIVNGSTAIGARAVVAASNQLELGDNNVTTTLGMSTFVPSFSPNVTRLEINTANGVAPFTVVPTGASPAYVNPGNGGTGWSGLRFDDLTTASTPGKNPGPGYLSVDKQGNVIYVDTALTTGGGTILGAQNAAFVNLSNHFVEWGTNPLLHHTFVPMGDPVNPALQFNAVFQDQLPVSIGTNDVGIGIPVSAGASLIAKLDVRTTTESATAWFQNSNPGANTLVNSWYTGVPTTAFLYGFSGHVLTVNGAGGLFSGGQWGVLGEAAYGLNSVENVGVWGLAGTSNLNMGVEGNVISTVSLENDYGVYGEADHIGTCTSCLAYDIIGTAGYAIGLGLHNYGIFGYASGGVIDNWAGFFSGSVYSSGGYFPSDSILKDSIQPIQNAMATIMKLTPRSYVYDTANYPQLNLPVGKQYGLIAQDVQRVLPTSVVTVTSPAKYDSLGHMQIDSVSFKALSYNSFIPFLIGGMQQQQLSIDSLRNPKTGVVADSTGTLYTTTGPSTTQLPAVGANSFYTTSDQRCKTGITNIPNALSLVEKLNGVYFNFNRAAYPWKNFPAGQQVGFIAQAVDTVVPQVITQNDSGYYTMDYGRLTPLLVDAIKQQKQTNDSLRYTLDSLRHAFQNIQSCLAILCDEHHRHNMESNNSGDSNTTITNVQDVTLSGLADAPLLYQNIPNPFSTGTKINYFLPQGTVGASMVFYDSYGNLIKQLQLSQTGNGTLNVTPDNLTNGIYSYSLVVNGNVVDTKRMVIQK